LSGGSGGFNASAVMGGMMSAARMPQMLSEFRFGRSVAGLGENDKGEQGKGGTIQLAANRSMNTVNNAVYDNSHLSPEKMRSKIG